MLATSRETSHSNGPGSVSSKSRRSNDSCRSGVAHSPKLRRWASPHSCTVRPVSGREARSARHHRRRAAIEAPRGRCHPAVANRDEIGEADRVLAGDRRQRVGGPLSTQPDRLDSIAPARRDPRRVAQPLSDAARRRRGRDRPSPHGQRKPVRAQAARSLTATIASTATNQVRTSSTQRDGLCLVGVPPECK